MKHSKRIGRRYLAGLVIGFAILFFVVGTLGPAHRSPYYPLIVPVPALAAAFLGWRAWRSQEERSVSYSAAALAMLLLVLVFSHLLPRSAA